MTMSSTKKKWIGEKSINFTESIFSKRSKNVFWKVVYYLYKHSLALFNLSFFPIESIASYYRKIGENRITKLIENRFGVTYHYITITSLSKATRDIIHLPNLCLSTFKNVLVAGNSDIIVDVNHGCIINDTCYNIKPNIMFVDGLLYRQKNNLGILRSNLRHVEKTINSGIMISGKFSSNYYHVIFENLIRLILVGRSLIPQDVPLLVDEKVLSISSFNRILEILSKDLNREVISLCPNKIYKCEILYYFDHINQLAPHCLNMNYDNAFIYDSSLLSEYKDILLKEKSERAFPTKIFISRKSAKGRTFNEDEVFGILSKYGFVKVAPEEFTFEEQMTLFNGAQWIVGGSGAALTNLLFCKAGCKVLCFRSSYIGEEPSIFNTIAYLNGCDFWYMEPKASSDLNSVHSDYIVNIKDLDSFLKPFFKN